MPQCAADALAAGPGDRARLGQGRRRALVVRSGSSAIALVPLALWFVIAVIGLAGADRDTVVDWVRHPVPAVCWSCC